MKYQRLVGLPAGFGQVDCFHYILGFQGWGEDPGNDLPGVKVHDAGQVGKSLMGVDVGNIGTPYGVRPVRIELLVQNVVQFLAEVGINRGSDPGFDPLSPDSHFPHVGTDRSLGDPFSFLLEFPGNLWRPVILVGAVVNLLDPLLDSFLSELGFRRPVLKEGLVARSRDAKEIQHSGEGDRASRCFGGLHLGSDFDVCGCRQSLPRMLMAFFSTSSASSASRSLRFSRAISFASSEE